MRSFRVLLYCHAGCSLDEVLEAAGLSKGDLLPGGSSQRAKVERIWIAALKKTWEGKDGATALGVLQAHCTAAWAAAKVEGYGLSTRRAADLANISSLKAVTKAHFHLQELDWLKVHYPHDPHKGKATLWTLKIPEGDWDVQEDNTRTYLDGSLSTFKSVIQLHTPRHDTFRWRGLGPNAQRIWLVLKDQHMIGNHIAQTLGLNPGTVYRRLKVMAVHGLVEKQPDGTWKSLSPDLDEVAMDLGVAGAGDFQKARHMLERWVREGVVTPTEAQAMLLDLRTWGAWPQKPAHAEPISPEEIAEVVLEPEKEAV
jgi:hypothetical protein